MRVTDAEEYTVEEGDPGLVMRVVVEVMPEPDLLIVYVRVLVPVMVLVTVTIVSR